jgi:hypothetical protein
MPPIPLESPQEWQGWSNAHTAVHESVRCRDLEGAAADSRAAPALTPRRPPPRATRTRDPRVKSPEALCPEGFENGRNDAAHVGLVPLVYVSQSVIAETPRVPPMLDDASSGPASASGDLVADFTTRSAPPEPPWTLLLRPAQRGDDAEARALAMRLAHQVLAESVIALAHEVLAGGPHATAKAIELAGASSRRCRRFLRAAESGRALMALSKAP